VKVTSHGKGLLPFQAATREMIGNLAKDCGDVLAAFFRGQVLVMIGSGVVYTVGLYILGLDLALLVGVLAGLLTVVPYLGFISGIVLALSAAAIQFHSLMPLIWVLVIFAVGVLCENFVFSPLFVGDRIGLHPVAVIFAVLAGGKLFGFVGVLLALPVAAVIMVLFRYWHKRYFESETLQKGEAA
jgi:predicted PurR-regulated permease PerM